MFRLCKYQKVDVCSLLSSFSSFFFFFFFFFFLFENFFVCLQSVKSIDKKEGSGKGKKKGSVSLFFFLSFYFFIFPFFLSGNWGKAGDEAPTKLDKKDPNYVSSDEE